MTRKKDPQTQFDSTGDSRLYRRLRRLYIADVTGGCSYCRPHKGENATRPSKCWKDTTKVRRQYMKKSG